MIGALLVSCGEAPDAPKGMQVVYASSDDGYVFYGPEGWVISNRAGVAASYVSRINRTSISFAKTELPEGVSVEGYFDSVKDEFAYEITPADEESFGKRCLFGTDESTVAYKYIYTFKLLGKDTQDTDRDGNQLNQPIKEFDHAMDAMRYAAVGQLADFRPPKKTTVRQGKLKR
jgi:hypothetical protein